jgi:hypothetical protein
VPVSVRKYFGLPLKGSLGLSDDEIEDLLKRYYKRGKKAEERFQSAWADPKDYPAWMKYVRVATWQEDRKEKTDAVIGTSNGGLYKIQIKAAKKISRDRRKTFYRQGIVLVQVPDDHTPKMIRDTTLWSVEDYNKYRLLLKERAQKEKAKKRKESHPHTKAHRKC